MLKIKAYFIQPIKIHNLCHVKLYAPGFEHKWEFIKMCLFLYIDGFSFSIACITYQIFVFI